MGKNNWREISRLARECLEKLYRDVEEGEKCFQALLEEYPDDGIIYLRWGEGYKNWYERTDKELYREKATEKLNAAYERLPSQKWKEETLKLQREITGGQSTKEKRDISPPSRKGEDDIIIREILQAVKSERERLEDPKNRQAYFMFGKSDEDVVPDRNEYQVFFEEYRERILIDMDYAKGEHHLVKVGNEFIDARVEKMPDRKLLKVCFPLHHVTLEEIKGYTDNGMYYISDFRDTVQKLYEFLESRKEHNPFLRHLCGESKPNRLHPCGKTAQYALNEVQMEALKKALSQDITFIWGPPGTGKTKTLAAIATELFRRENRVLLISLANKTLDHLFQQVVKSLEADKKGIRDDDCFRLVRLWSERTGEPPEDIKPFCRKKIPYGEPVIVAGNYSQLLYRGTSVVKAFDYVLMDEVSMTPIPSLIAASYYTRKGMVLGGDPYQLPPPYPENAETPNEWYAKNVFEKVNIVDIGRKNDSRSVFLNIQYRMAKEINDLVSEQFYKGELRCGTDVGTASWTDYRGEKRRFPHSVRFVDTSGPMQDLGTLPEMDYRRNEVHAKAIADLVNRLLMSRIAYPEEIAVIAPYNAQVSTIYKFFKAKKIQGVRAATVHAFQGQERRIVIVDVTDDNIEPSTLTTNKKLMNVALSRAQQLLVILGNREYLLSPCFNDEMKGVLGAVIRKGTWAEKDEILSLSGC